MIQFDSVNKEVKEAAVIGTHQLFMIYQLSNYAIDLDGDVAEVGVYKGGSAKFLSRIFPNKQIYLFDTFIGIPSSDSKKDRHKKGDYAETTLAETRDYLSDCDNTHIYEGVFPHSAVAVKDKRFCFAHIDADIYKSTYDCCVFFYSRLVKNAIMVFDDYNSPTCPGVNKAIDEFFSDKKEYVISLPTKQAFIIKK